MRDYLQARKRDFARRADFAPKDVRTHSSIAMRYLPVHRFGGAMVDAWCEFSSEVALVESFSTAVVKRSPGIWIRRDGDAPQFLKILAVVSESSVTQEWFEQLLATLANHPWCAAGFRAVPAGSDLALLPSS
jgi:hypothetical protein